MIDWQPIETGPEDGTRVLLYDGYEPDICFGSYDADRETWIRSSYKEFWRQPTHWAPWEPPTP